MTGASPVAPPATRRMPVWLMLHAIVAVVAAALLSAVGWLVLAAFGMTQPARAQAEATAIAAAPLGIALLAVGMGWHQWRRRRHRLAIALIVPVGVLAGGAVVLWAGLVLSL